MHAYLPIQGQTTQNVKLNKTLFVTVEQQWDEPAPLLAAFAHLHLHGWNFYLFLDGNLQSLLSTSSGGVLLYKCPRVERERGRESWPPSHPDMRHPCRLLCPDCARVAKINNRQESIWLWQSLRVHKFLKTRQTASIKLKFVNSQLIAFSLSNLCSCINMMHGWYAACMWN